MKLPQCNFLQSPSPLWLRICLALIVTLILVASAAMRLGLEQREQELESTLKERSWRTLQLLSAGALESVISEDIEHLDTLVRESARLDPDLLSISIFNESDQLLITWGSADVERPANNHTYATNIEFEGEKFGHILASWNPTRVLEKIRYRQLQERNRLIYALLTLTCLSLVLLRLLVVSPVIKLRDRLAGVSLGKQFEPLTITSSREMSMLAKAVNDLDKAMADSRSLSLELEYQASHDRLTGLTNRYAFEKKLKEHLQNRQEDQNEATLLYVDLDQFKLVNDTCGHAAGDALLIQLSTILKNQLKDDVVFARLGGDEFALLLIDTPLDAGLAVAERIRLTAQAFRFSWDKRTFSVETSIGAVPINRQNDDFERLLSAADEACYSAKHEGRNRVHCYLEDDEELRERRDQGDWIPKILEALESSRLVLYGQPIEPTDRNLKHDEHLEILVRMLDENGQIIPPGAFLPAAERYGLMPQIDKYVVTATIEWLVEQTSARSSQTSCAINISGHSICDPDFKQFVFDALKKKPLLCTHITFEVTETAAVANLASAVDFMTEIKRLGCKFALDDFGSGMSSFTYLKNLPVDYIKIDGAFVQNLLADPTSLAMVRAISDIAAVMQIRSIAEYVENDEIRDKLLEIGIDFVQGFGVAKPAPLDNFEQASHAA